LRMDSHAQWEIQEFARAMYDLVKPLFPQVCEAFEDYEQYSISCSRMEVDLIKRLIGQDKWLDLLEDFRDINGIAKQYGMGQREIKEFTEKWLTK